MSDNVISENISERKVDALGRSYGTGRRKTSVARLWFKKVVNGSSVFKVNNMDVEKYFSRKFYQDQINLPLNLFVKDNESYQIKASVKGGGSTGQCGAIRLAISRAILNFDPEMRASLRQLGLLTRDPRKVERKKFGLHKARRAPQFRKR
ncbi:MAG: 30S ribosomal protein S9 [Alphaproteobacteria bacterium]|nr:MAG: 30S ribosomal protein S9 [Alphaproteobacteria bacterium]